DEDDDDEVSLSKDNDDNEDDDGQDDDNEQTESDNDGDNAEGEEMDEEEINKEEEVNELYRDVNVNLERRDTKMTDALQTNVQGTQVIEDTHVIITAPTPEVQQQSSSVSSGFISNMLNPNPDTGIESILNLNIESTSLVDVPITTNVEMPPSSVITLPPPPIPLIQPQQQTIVPSTSLQNLPTFGSLFKFKDRVKALEDDFLEFKQTNLFAKSKGLRDEARAQNEDFINKLDENIKKIIKEQVKVQVKEQVTKILLKIEKLVNNQLEAEVLICSSNQAKTSHNLYKALVDAYESEKDILASYGDIVTLKRCRDDTDDDEEPSIGSNRGSKRRRARKEPESTSAPKEKTSKSTGKSKEGSKSDQKSTGKSAQAEEPIHANEDLNEPAHKEFDTGFTEDQPIDETTQHPDCTLARKEDPRESFNELMDTPLDFSAFVLNWLKVDTLTLELSASPTFELMKGSCKILVELKYFLEEVYKATTDHLDWNNPEGQQYPHDLRKPLPLIPNSQGHRVIPFDHFINNDLAYLSGSVSSRSYATSVTKTKAADYGHIKWIEDLVPNTMESARDVYSRNRIIGIKKLTIVEWHNYKHLEWITIRKLANLNITERLDLGVSLRMFTRSIIIRRILKDGGEVLVVKRYLIFFMEQLVGVANSLVVDVNNPSVGTPKGRRKLRIKGGNKKEIKKSLKNKNACLLCGSFDHNKRRCPKRFEDQEQVVVQQEVVVQEEVVV
ncbi:hypothetical protein Tco_1458299, partial [Tanacetum coccineum]